MKRITRITVAVALFALLPAVLLAQDELTLENLAETVAGLTERIDAVEVLITGPDSLSDRVATIEALFTGPGSTAVPNSTECITGERRSLQDESVIKHKEKYDEWADPEDAWIVEVRYDVESETVKIKYELGLFEDKFVVETWDGCEFLHSSEWWEE